MNDNEMLVKIWTRVLMTLCVITITIGLAATIQAEDNNKRITSCFERYTPTECVLYGL